MIKFTVVVIIAVMATWWGKTAWDRYSKGGEYYDPYTRKPLVYVAENPDDGHEYPAEVVENSPTGLFVSKTTGDPVVPWDHYRHSGVPRGPHRKSHEKKWKMSAGANSLHLEVTDVSDDGENLSVTYRMAAERAVWAGNITARLYRNIRLTGYSTPVDAYVGTWADYNGTGNITLMRINEDSYQGYWSNPTSKRETERNGARLQLYR